MPTFFQDLMEYPFVFEPDDPVPAFHNIQYLCSQQAVPEDEPGARSGSFPRFEDDFPYVARDILHQDEFDAASCIFSPARSPAGITLVS